jgi:hypothetical protein
MMDKRYHLLIVAALLVTGSIAVFLATHPEKRIEHVALDRTLEGTTNTGARLVTTDRDTNAHTSPRAAETPAHENDAGALVVTVLDAATSKPIPGALVTMFTPESLADLCADGDHGDAGFYDIGRLERSKRAPTSLGATDASGKLRTRRVSGDTTIVGTLDTRWGLTALPRSDHSDNAVVVLYQDSIAEIPVRDTLGRVLSGARVRVRPSHAAEAAHEVDFESTAIVQDGFSAARVPHIGWLLRSHPSEEYRASVEALLCNPISVRVALDQLAGTSDALVLPEVGQVTVHLADTVALPGAEAVLYVLDGDRGAGGSAAQSRVSPTRSLRIISCDHTQTFASVEVGLRLHAEARYGTPPRRLTSEASGPARSCEQVIIELVDKNPPTTFTGRAVAGDGTTLRGTDLYEELAEGMRGRLPIHVRTAEDGAFAIPGPALQQSGPESSLILSTQAFPYSGEVPPMSAELQLASLAREGRHELGDVVFHQMRPLASGVVVDDAGQGWPSAVVVGVEKSQAPAVGPRRSDLPGRRATSSTRDDGTFVLWGCAEAESLAVYAQDRVRETIRSPELVVPGGATDIKLTLRRAGGIAGRLLFDPRASALAFQITCTWENVGGAGGGTSITPIQVEPGVGTFQFQSVPTGHASLVVRPEYGGPALNTIQPVQVEAGKETDAGDLDIRGAITIIVVDVRGEDGRSIAHPDVWWSASAGEPRWKAAAVDQSRVCIATRDMPIDVVATAPGYETSALMGTSTEGVIRLVDAIKATIKISAPYMPAGYTMTCTLRRVNRQVSPNIGPPRLFETTATCDNASPVIMLVPQPGKYTASFALVPLTTHPNLRAIELGPSTEVVLSRGQENTVNRTFTGQDLERLMGSPR